MRLVFLAFFCISAPAHADDLADVLTSGVWGATYFDDQRCEDNPHTIQITPDGKRMIFLWRAPILYHDGTHKQQIGADITARQPDRLVIRQDGEDRLGHDGTTLQFDIFLRTDGGYCFIETGFGFEDCSAPNLPCPASLPTS